MADAKAAFNSNYNYDLDYVSEITLGSGERDLCGDCAIEFMETKISSQEGYDEYAKQQAIVNELVVGVETLSEAEFAGLYSQLDTEHQMEVDRLVREFADDAVGDEHWDSDNYSGALSDGWLRAQPHVDGGQGVSRGTCRCSPRSTTESSTSEQRGSATAPDIIVARETITQPDGVVASDRS